MIWIIAAAYVVGAVALAVALGRRLRAVRVAHEQLAALHRRHLGL